MTGTPDPVQPDAGQPRFGAMAAGYGVAIAVAVTVFLGPGQIAGPDRGIIAAVYGYAFAFALPGYLLVRWALWVLRQENAVAFGLAGMVNALIILGLFSVLDALSGTGPSVTLMTDVVQIMLPSGLAAGLAAWCVERLLQRRM
jgi:hypothetical protein